MKICITCRVEHSLETGFYAVRKYSRDGYTHECKECLKARGRRWKADNHQRHIETNMAWAKKNPEKIAGYTEKMKPQLSKRRHEYYEENKETIKANASRWKKENRDANHAILMKRRALKRAAFVEVVRRDYLAKRDGWLCGICREIVARENWSVDHIIPLSKGGEHSYANTQIAHLSCNVSKNAKMPEEMLL